jgi:hypothetical protein
MKIARELDPGSADAFGTGLMSALRRFRDGVAAGDDETVIVLQIRAIPSNTE